MNKTYVSLVSKSENLNHIFSNSSRAGPPIRKKNSSYIIFSINKVQIQSRPTIVPYIKLNTDRSSKSKYWTCGYFLETI